MKWTRPSRHVLVSDDGYKICRMVIDRKVLYRPSFSGEFICEPQAYLDEAKAICERHDPKRKSQNNNPA